MLKRDMNNLLYYRLDHHYYSDNKPVKVSAHFSAIMQLEATAQHPVKNKSQ